MNDYIPYYYFKKIHDLKWDSNASSELSKSHELFKFH